MLIKTASARQFHGVEMAIGGNGIIGGDVKALVTFCNTDKRNVMTHLPLKGA